jgi:hypothetical protein
MGRGASLVIATFAPSGKFQRLDAEDLASEDSGVVIPGIA